VNEEIKNIIDEIEEFIFDPARYINNEKEKKEYLRKLLHNLIKKNKEWSLMEEGFRDKLKKILIEYEELTRGSLDDGESMTVQTIENIIKLIKTTK